jgi:Sortase and related acyltransferases
MQDHEQKTEIELEQITDASSAKTAFDLASKIWAVCYKDIISQAQIDYMIARMYSRETIAAESSAGTPYYIVKISGRPCGVISFDSQPDAGGVCVLHKIYLLPELWGKGLGGRLLARSADAARESGARALQLSVNKSNTRAVKAYERAGFAVKAELTEDIGNGFVRDDYLMEMPLRFQGNELPAAR